MRGSYATTPLATFLRVGSGQSWMTIISHSPPRRFQKSLSRDTHPLARLASPPSSVPPRFTNPPLATPFRGSKQDRRPARRSGAGMDAGDLSIVHHIGLVLVALWAAASFGWCHSVVFLIAFLYLYMASMLLLLLFSAPPPRPSRDTASFLELRARLPHPGLYRTVILHRFGSQIPALSPTSPAP